MEQRITRLRKTLAEQELTAILITGDTNRRYLSGFSGSAGALLITANTALLLTDFRYTLRAEREAPTFLQRQITPDKPLPKLLVELATELGLHRLGFEAEQVSVRQLQKFTEAFHEAQVAVPPELVPVDGLVEPLREVKDTAEIAALRRAIAVTDEALAAVLPNLTPEHTERAAAWLLEVALRECGAEALSFPIIVAAGLNAALPHAEPGDELLGTGQPIVIDMGGRVDGYCADLTRTVVVGEPDARFRELYNLVLQAQQQALAQIQPEMEGKAADALTRDYLSAAGFGTAFGHSLGHGVGLDIHEGPRLSRTSADTLQAGNVFSVEPGIYLPDWGGIRIEDLVLLTEAGCEVLSQAPKYQW